MRSYVLLSILGLLLMTPVFGAPSQPEPETHQHKESHHQGGHHDFSDAEKWIKKFEDPARDEWQKPDLVVKKLGLKPGMNVADIGAASGYFTRRLAKEIEPGGFALAVDIESNFFPYVIHRAHEEGQYNLFCVESTPDDPRLPTDTIDLILIVDTLHHIEQRPAYYERLKKCLRKNGRVVVVDFKKYAKIPVGPKPEMRLKAESVQQEFEDADFEVSVDNETLEFQYIVTATLRP
jgi:cyclopropane fatty-acyl-phospholipid synthase-like methyltransferase